MDFVYLKAQLKVELDTQLVLLTVEQLESRMEVELVYLKAFQLEI